MEGEGRRCIGRGGEEVHRDGRAVEEVHWEGRGGGA